ncbi:MFS general substrate transporter [Neoconidiobolus thromboides FSU 785]|nr:MFS general substrate transporter [Neoconidiobolus thromboides FSU 785]
MDGRTMFEDFEIKKSSKTKVTTRLDHLTWSRWHTKLVIVLGIGWAFDAFEITIITAILPIIKRYFDVTSEQTSLITTLWLVGAIVGSLGFGLIADRYGRKFTFVITMLLYSSMTLITCFSPTFEFLLAFRFLTAIGVGAEYTAINATIVEFIPYRYRGRANAAVMGFWCLGALIAHGLQVPIIRYLNDFWAWRVGFLIGACASFFIIFIRRFLLESPRWLLSQGQFTKAEEITMRIEELCQQQDNLINSGPEAEIIFYAHPKNSFFRILKNLFLNYPFTVFFAAILNASQAFADYGVSNLLSLQILEDVGITGSDNALFFLYGVICTVPSYIYVVLMIDRVGRKPLLIFHFIICIIAVACFIPAVNNSDPKAALIGIHCFYQFTYSAVMATIYTTISEAFPTHLRATGIGFSVAIGRVIAAIAPRILLAIYENNTLNLVIPCVVIICFLSSGLLVSLLWMWFGIEGKNTRLEDMGYKTEVTTYQGIALETLS